MSIERPVDSQEPRGASPNLTADRATHPIFVVGYQHTGTTLMQYLLGRNPDVFGVRHESKYFEYLGLTTRRHPSRRSAAERDAFVRYVAGVVEHGYPVKDGRTVDGHDVSDLPTSLGGAEIGEIAERVGDDPIEVFRAVNDVLAARQGRSRWLEKTPSHIFQISEILDWFPDARAVGMIRDPRDSLASKKNRRQGLATNERVAEHRRKSMHLQLGYDIFLDAMSLRSAVRAGQAVEASHPDRFLTVQYEELVREPESVVGRVCEFLGLEFDDGMLDVTARHGERRISSDRVGRWKEILTPSETALCQSVLREEMTAYGYEAADVTVRARIGCVPLYVRAGVDISRRLTRKLRLGGPGYVFNVLRNWGRRWRGRPASSPRS